MPSVPPLLERYRDMLAEQGETFPLTLGEGGTPLLHAQRLGEELGLDRLFLKVEGANPTGSFKDRGMVLAVNRAIGRGAQAVVCASTGNTSASAAAYAAADAEVLPVDAHTTACAPLASARLTASTMPRSLKLPVGLVPSNLRCRLVSPSSSPRRRARTSGVNPSPRVSGNDSSEGCARRSR